MANRIDTETYQERRTWFIEIWEIAGWRLKVYGINATGLGLQPETVEAARNYIADNLSFPDSVDHRFGFVILHAGEEAVWLLVDLWVKDILRHFLYSAPIAAPDQFVLGPADGTTACVWELAVIAHERNAWIEHALSRPADPDFDGYLRDTVEIRGQARS